MSPVLGIVGGVVGLVLVWFFMIRKSGKTRSLSSSQQKTAPKKVTGVVVDNKKETIIRQLIARGALSKEEADKVRATVNLDGKQPQTPVVQIVNTLVSLREGIPVVEQSAVAIMSQKYKAMVISDEGIGFKLVPQKLGNPMFLEPSMPARGSHLLVVEKDGRWSSYDPRLEAIASSETPQRAYSAVNCYEIVSAVYANKLGMWEKINTILVALMGCGFILVAIVAIDKLG